MVGGYSMVTIRYLEHINLTEDVLIDIIHVKSIAWNYNYEEHQKWMELNLKENDIHFLLYSEEKLMAYLNLIPIEIKTDEIVNFGYGIGNVCSIEKGKGWGVKLMMHVNEYLRNENKIGLLFCKETLVKFYLKNCWKKVDVTNNLINFSDNGVFSFIYPPNIDFEYMEYNGKLF